MTNDNKNQATAADGSIITWGSYTPEAAAADDGMLAASSGSFFKFQAGRNVLRFLPPPAGKNNFAAVTQQHFIRLPGMQKPVTFNCPRLMNKSFCPCCAKVDQLRGTGEKADYDLAGEIMAKPRIYANIIDRAHPDKGPQTVAYGKTIHEALTGVRQDPDAGGDFTHPFQGFDIVVVKSGTTKNDTEYKVRVGKTSPLGDLGWIAAQPDLGRYAKVPTSDEVKRMLAGEEIAPLLGSGSTTSRVAAGGRRTVQADLDTSGEEIG